MNIEQRNSEKFNSIIEILKGVEYREITNLLNAVGSYIESKKNTNYFSEVKEVKEIKERIKSSS